MRRLGRDLDLGRDELLVVAVARPEHHAMLAEGDRPAVAIGRDVADRKDRHLASAYTSLRSAHLKPQWRARPVPAWGHPPREEGGKVQVAALSRAIPIGGSSVRPASTSATWRTSTIRPSRQSLPAMFMRQPRSPASSVGAPVSAMRFVLSSTMAFEMSPYFTAKVPPKPQQTSESAISTSSRPGMLARSRRGWRATPSSRRPEHESW